MDFIDYIWAFVQWLGNFLWAALQYVFQVLISVANYIWSAIVQVATFVWNGLVKVAGFFRHLWDGFFKNIFNRVFNAILKVHDWLEAHLRPIIDFLKKVRAWYDRFYKQFVRPILNMMQTIRRILQVLRFLHLQWAKQLDAWIAKIEGRISSVFLQIRGILNSTIDFLNALADPMRLIRHPTLVLSARRIFNGMVRVLTGRPPGYFFPSPRKSAASGLGNVPVKTAFDAPFDNPLASSYLDGNDGLGSFDGFAPGAPPPVTAVDDLDALDYFDDDLYPDPACDDIVECLREALQLATEKNFSG